MRRAVIALISLYRYCLSPFLGNHCRFHPSCSSYAQQAIEEYGLLQGSGMALRRLARCHPWHEGGADPLPDRPRPDRPRPDRPRPDLNPSN